MKDSKALKKIFDLLKSEQTALSESAKLVADAIKARHSDAVLALIFYGSAMRDVDDPEKMLDFSVIVKSYDLIYRNPVLRLATAALPPGVHYIQIEDANGRKLRSKYAIVSEAAFYRRVSGGLESMFWARFVQPTRIHTESDEMREKLIQTLAEGCAHFYDQAAPLVESGAGPEDVWIHGLAQSYRTELRPEKPLERAQEIVERNPERYAELTRLLQSNTEFSNLERSLCRVKWMLRRLNGKPRGAARVIKAALTFDDGLDYVLEKVRSHSGVQIEVGDWARRHPILSSPIIAWRLYRAGGFR